MKNGIKSNNSTLKILVLEIKTPHAKKFIKQTHKQKIKTKKNTKTKQ